MNRIFLSETKIFRIAQVLSQAFTANAATDIITSAAHGLSNEDRVVLTTTTTLPAGLSLLTKYYIINATTNTFQLSATLNGSAVNFTDAGTGTHTYTVQGKMVFTNDFGQIELILATTNVTGLTLKVQTSNQDDVNFSVAQSPTNKWSYLDLRCDDTGSDATGYEYVSGSVGIVLTANKNLRFRLETNGQKWVNAQVSGFTAGNVELSVVGYN